MRHSVRVKCLLIKIAILWILCVNFAPYCDCLCWNCFAVTYVRSSCFIWVHYAVIFIVLRSAEIIHFFDWKFAIINFVINFLKMWPFPNFHLLIFKNSILLICIVYIVFAVYFLLAYLYPKLFTVFVYGSWICIFLYEYIWKSVYWSVYLNIQMIFCSSVLLACFS